MTSAVMSIDSKKSGEKHRLTINERIMLHLLGNLKFKDSREAPQDITQRGIAEAVHIRWNHVPRAMAKLRKLGYVFERATHIEGKTRRQKTYYLTDEGMWSARNVKERILGWDIYLKKLDGQVVKMKLSEVNSELKAKFSPLRLCLSLSDEDMIEVKELLHVAEEVQKKAAKTSFVSGEMSWPEKLIGREKELKTIHDWLDGDRHRTIIIYGSIGVGKSALMAEILKGYKDKRNIFWYQLSEKDSQKDVLASLSEFLSKLGKRDLTNYIKDDKSIELSAVMRMIDRGLGGKEVILAFDNYFKVSEAMVDFFSGLADLAVKKDGFNVIITAMETTPFYCRFYDKKDVRKKRIAELTIKGLDMEGTKRLLGNPSIDDDALKKIHLMTRGNPLTIELIKLGDVMSLKRIKGFSRQEASLLLYLKGVEKKA